MTSGIAAAAASPGAGCGACGGWVPGGGGGCWAPGGGGGWPPDDTQIGLDNQEPEYTQFRVTGGQVALDLRGLPPNSTLEVDTPNAALTVDRPGYYHLDVNQDSSRLGVYRGGSATMTPAAAPPPPSPPTSSLS